MPNIKKIVDKTLVYGSEKFTYTYFLDFSDLSNPNQKFKIVDFIPRKIKYALPQLTNNITHIYEMPDTGGKRLEFILSQINSGTSLSFQLGCSFGPGRVDNDTFTNTASLYADDAEIGSATADEVKVLLSEDMKISKSTVGSSTVNPGDTKTIYLDIKNVGDPGKIVSDIVVTDPLPQGIIPDTTFTPIGYCLLDNGYYDTTYDDLTGTWNNNELTFTLPKFTASVYRIEFKVKIADTAEPGTSLKNTSYLKVGGVDTDESSLLFNVLYNGPKIVLSKDAPNTATIGGPILYKLCANNRGNEKLTGIVFTDKLPPEVKLTKLQFQADPNFVNSYTLRYDSTKSPGMYMTLASNISGTSENYDVSSFVSEPDRILSLMAILSSMEADVTKAACFNLLGYVDYSATQGQVIVNEGNIFGRGTSGTAAHQITASTILDGKSTLSIKKTIPHEKPQYYSLDEFTIEMKTAGDFNQIVNPVFADLLPDGLDYAPGHDYIIYTNYLGDEYDSRNDDFPIQMPVTEIIRNYMGTGRTLVRYKFTGFTLISQETLAVRFNAVVEINPPGSFVNYAYLGNPGDNAVVNPNIFYSTPVVDEYDLDGDGIFDENIARSQLVSASILSSSEFALQKWVHGDMDTDFSKYGFVTPGGDIIYKLYVTNNQLIDLKDIEIVDILPYVGDTGVILNTTPRGSQFNVYAVSDITASLENVVGDPVDPFPYIKIEYSTSSDPVRFDHEGTSTIGTGTWSLTPPADVTKLAAIRITTGPDVILKPYDRLVVTLHAKAPVGASPNLAAYNSFAVKANKVESSSVVPMNPTEPLKVCISIMDNSSGSIGDFVWLDSNRDGLHDTDETGVNGILVELYDEHGTRLSETATSNDANGQPGYYIFKNLDVGNYYVKFIPYGDYSLTLQRTDQNNGSTPDNYSGLTPRIILNENEHLTTIDAGVVLPSVITPQKTAPAVVPCGQTFDYTLIFTNSEKCVATNVKITDNLPEGFILTQITAVNNGQTLKSPDNYTYTTTSKNVLVINGVGNALYIKTNTSLVVTIRGYYPCDDL